MQAAWEAHTEKGTVNKEPLSIEQTVTHTVVQLCLYKPW